MLSYRADTPTLGMLTTYAVLCTLGFVVGGREADAAPGARPGIAAYLFKTFVWPARRVRFDGEPVVLPSLEADRDGVKPEELELPEPEGASAA